MRPGPYPRYDGRRALGRRHLNDQSGQVESRARDLADGVNMTRTPGGQVTALPRRPRPGFWACLTAETGGGYYSWTRLKDDAETETADTGSENAKEVNETEELDVGEVGTGVVVWMWFDRTDREYRFAYERPGFWARLTAETETGGGYYSWTRLKNDAETLVDPAVTGTDDAKEVNETEEIANGTVVRMWLDRANSEYRFVYVPSVTSTAVVKVVSYATGTYVVQPVVRVEGSWTNDGDPLSEIYNYGEVQADEVGYLAGPGGQDIYVPLLTAGDESFMLVHPPRMV